MKKRVFLLFLIFSVVTISGKAQDLPFLIDNKVPDSIRLQDYQTVREKFFALIHNDIQVIDTLLLELYGKDLIIKATGKNDHLEVSNFYDTLSDYRENCLPTIDYVLKYTKTHNLDEFYIEALIRKALFFINTESNLEEAYSLAQEAYDKNKRFDNPVIAYTTKYIMAVLLADSDKTKEAIKMYLELEELYHTDVINQIFKFDTDQYIKEALTAIQYNLALAYFRLHNYIKASEYINKVKEYADVSGTNDFLSKYLGLKGGILIRQGSYNEGLKFTNEYLDIAVNLDNDEFSHSYTMQGIAYRGLHQPEKALTSFLTADSLRDVAGSDYLFSDLKVTYEYLHNHYKQTGDVARQIEYLNKMIAYEEEYGKLSQNIGDEIIASYTLPELLLEKENAIKTLEEEKESRNIGIILFVILGLAAISFAIYQYRRRLKLKQRFINLRDTYSERITTEEKPEETTAVTRPVVQNHIEGALSHIKPAQLEKIQEGLDSFEKKALFTSHNVTLKSLANQIGTNASYLSKYINVEKSENFSTYLNDLRINYVLKELYNNPKLKSYTVAAIAEEVGFSNVKSFSTHFKRVTGLSVSYFIKNLSSERDSFSKEEKDGVINLSDRVNKAG
ncbi:transcription regulator, AraC family [Dokdonia sp. MED134]|uniref:helix-turn-helix domain-containing protein n=1 Tax=Dokdonia sp. MED134 TaxID=313590 RepID=UPI0004F895E8|nr:helix-turn-helix domain-containing protein [Dokdonia sp. MED134]EAQ40039.2 transcription regulator, AraC family [Dokdonia sp. MED134]